MRLSSSYLEHLLAALFQLCWPLNAFCLFSTVSCIQKPKHLSIPPAGKCLKEGVPNICLKTESPTGRVSQYWTQEGQPASGFPPRVSPAQWGVAVFIGESSQTHSFRCTHKNKAYLNVLFRSRLSWLTWTLFPWEACLGEGWLYCHVQETCDTWDVHLSHCWHSAASEDQEGGVCTGTPQKWEPVLERWQSRVCSKALGATFQITIWDRRPLYAELQTRGHQKWKLQHPKLHQACLALVSCNHSELSIPSIFKLCWH